MMTPDGFGALLTTLCNWLVQKNNNKNALLDTSDLDHRCSIFKKPVKKYTMSHFVCLPAEYECFLFYFNTR